MIILIILIVLRIVVPSFLMGGWIKYPKYQFYPNQETDTEQLKQESIQTSYLNLDYSEVPECKTGVPPWDCGLESLRIGKIEMRKNFWTAPEMIGDYYE